MRVFVPAFLCLFAVSACAPQDLDTLTTRIQDAQTVCPVQNPGSCAFTNSPVRTGTQSFELPRRPYPFFKTSEKLEFVDALGRRWLAPADTLTDGASIPPIFVSIVGNPRDPQFANAAAVHDAYCGVGNEQGPVFHDGKWQDVHRMFYDALIAGGTPRGRAGLMFAAVYLGGPRWNVSYEQDLNNVLPNAKKAALRRIQRFIERDDPPFYLLMLRLLQEERGLLATELVEREPRTSGGAASGPSYGYGGGGSPVYGSPGYGSP